MKTVAITFLITILLSSLSLKLHGINCDSIVIRTTRTNFNNSGWGPLAINIQTYHDSRLISVSDPNGNISSYIYDTLGRTIKFISDGHTTHYSYDSLGNTSQIVQDSVSKLVLNYDQNGNDSINYSYGFDGTNYYIISEKVYTYDINFNLTEQLGLNFNSTTAQWDSSSVIRSDYSADSLVRTDSYYYYPGPVSRGQNIFHFDSLGRTIRAEYYQFMYMQSTTNHYDAACTYNIDSSRYNISTAGPGGSTTDASDAWYYDSFCRPVKVISLISEYFNSPLPNDIKLIETNYYYANCNEIIVVGSDTVVMCDHDHDSLNIHAYGGSGDYTYLWSAADSLSSYTILNPVVFSDSGNFYNLAVEDTLGNITHFQTVVSINRFSTTVTNTSCSACDDGQIEINYPGIASSFSLTVMPDSGLWLGSVLTGLVPGNYFICSGNAACTFCDSVRVSSPIGVNEINSQNFINLFPNPSSMNINVIMEKADFKNNVKWELKDLQGRIVLQQSESNSNFIFSVEGIAKGLYILEINSYPTSSVKIVVN